MEAVVLFDLTQTRLDILRSLHNGMDEGLPENIPFIPDKVVHHTDGAVVTGMEGEVLWLDGQMNPLSEVSIPYPMRIQQAVVSNGHLHAMWLDRELLLAQMGSMPIGSSENGPRREELRTAINTTTVYSPAGTVWAHALDAEPMALVANEDVLVFMLYNRGLYSITTSADECWRRPPPTWSYPKKRPRGAETICVHIEADDLLVTSRGGRVQRRSLSTGNLIEEYLLLGVDGPVEHHVRHENNALVCSTTGEVVWLKDQTICQQVQLSGPIQHAVWDARLEGWRIAGWREEVVVATGRTERRETREIPVHVHPRGAGALILYNDGSWENSPFESSTPREEE